jgi:hypothetical protein
MLNRSAVVVRFRQPFIDWLNQSDPEFDGGMTLLEANEDSPVYLVEAEDERDFDRWLALNHDLVFEELLADWDIDQELWPSDRSLATLKLWCSFELHTTVLDTGEVPLSDDEADD